MGYSISQEQYETLERNKREGRLCHMSTGRGGCFNRATWKETHECWPYKIGDGESDTADMTLCGRHHMDVGERGVNFVVVAVERLPRTSKKGVGV